MDQDLDLTPSEPVPPVPPHLSTDEIFNKLFEEKKLTWVDVMTEIVEWIDLKYPAESDDINLSEKFSSFNSLIFNYYTNRK